LYDEINLIGCGGFRIIVQFLDHRSRSSAEPQVLLVGNICFESPYSIGQQYICRLTFEFTCILKRSGKMSGATICYTFFYFSSHILNGHAYGQRRCACFTTMDRHKSWCGL